MIRLRDYCIEYISEDGKTRFAKISALNNSDALQAFFEQEKNVTFLAIYLKQ